MKMKWGRGWPVGLRGFESRPRTRAVMKCQNGRVLGHAFFLKKEGYQEYNHF